ncbi:MAG TPA: hypothetical protein VIC26_10630 [Marinagarivorans sp.]
MGLAQISKQLGKSVEQELTLIFASMGDSRLPEAAHRCPNREHDQFDEVMRPQGPAPQGVMNKGMDASGLGPKTPKDTSH